MFAHTSPVHIEVGGKQVRRPESARWLLDWLDRFEHLGRDNGQFADDAQRDQVVGIIEQARRYHRG